jgi:hypothetical protein
MVKKETRTVKPETKFVQIAGRWRFEGTTAVYLGPDERNQPYGVCLAPNRFRSGSLSALATIQEPQVAARLAVGYNAGTGAYYSVGIGGYEYAYVIDEFAPGRGWRAVRATGAASQIRIGKPQLLEVSVSGQRVSLSVDGVRVLEDAVPFPLQGDQVGLFAWGEQEVAFRDFTVRGDKPRVFVVMQFGEPYDFLYRDVILPVAKKLEFEAFRADDVYRPGVILQDIIRGIVECDVVIADITPVNANVFYELGYAHAMQKPTVLLANRTVEKLPFDISGYRVVYYSDTIRGKGDITSALEKHLESIRLGRSVV